MIALAPIAIGLFWLLSLRRTPYATLWAIVCILNALGAVALGALGGHTLAGLLGIETGAAAPAAFFAFFTEVHATSDAKIARWRRRTCSPAWVVYAITQTAHTSLVNVGIEKGADSEKKWRRVGHADPLEDLDGFLDLKVRAQQAADTMNALGI